MIEQTRADAVSVESLQEMLLYEIYRALRLASGDWKRFWVEQVMRWPVMRCVQLAINFDCETALGGFCHASRKTLPRFVKLMDVHGGEQIPSFGPLIIAANHPGSIDAFLIAACVQRPDLKILARDMPFLRKLPHVHNCMIYATRDMANRAVVIRQAIRHLQSDGALLLFPSGNLDPDPAGYTGALESLETWTTGLALFVRKVPSVQVVVAVTSGMIAATWRNHPLVRLRRKVWDRQFLAELLQTSSQVLFPGRFCISPRVTFSQAWVGDEVGAGSDLESIRACVIAQARMLMERYHGY